MFPIPSLILLGMRSILASGQFHELIPIVSDFLIAAAPILLQIVENCITRMIMAGDVVIFLRNKRSLGATLVCADEFTVFAQLESGI
jgi:hypothetical protein